MKNSLITTFILCSITALPLGAAENSRFEALKQRINNKNNQAPTVINPETPLINPNQDQVMAVGDLSNSPVGTASSIIPAGTIAPPEETAKKPTLRTEAFRQFLDKAFPLTPEQIVELQSREDKNQQIINTSVMPPPRPISSTLTVDLSPGQTPPVVRLSAGYVSSIVFVDNSGQPWPIADYSVGNPKNFNIQWDKKTNALFIQNTAPYISGNLALRLAKLDTPIIISLVTNQREIDYRVDLQINARGPNASPLIGGEDTPNKASSNLLNVLDGLPPTGSKELEVPAGLGQAWLINNKIIFRTKLTVLSPAWISTVRSADGTQVYELSKTPLILASLNGKAIKIELKGL
ncbi:MAG: IcmK protein [Francisellaceae bacterium]|nr:IcmK protein [Francisellaceae bacterium]